MEHDAFVDALRGSGHAVITVGINGIDGASRVTGYPRTSLSDDEVFVRYDNFTLLCHHGDLEVLLLALKEASRRWGPERASTWRVRASTEISEALDEAITQIETARADNPAPPAPDSLLGRAVEAVTGTHALLDSEQARSEDTLIRERVEQKISQRAKERALRVELRKKHTAAFYLTIDDDGLVVGAARKRATSRDVSVRFDGKDTLGCAAGKVRRLSAAIRDSFGRSSALSVVDDDTFDAQDAPRLNEKAIEWAKFARTLDQIRSGPVQVKILRDGSNAGRIGYVQRRQRAERNADYYDYVEAVLDTDDGYALFCPRSGQSSVLKRALKKTFAARAAQVTVS